MALKRTVRPQGTPPDPARSGRAHHPNADLISMLRDAYAEHQDLMGRQDRNVEARRQVRARVQNGQAWLANHAEGHPRYQHNTRLLAALREELSGLEAQAVTLVMGRKGQALAAWECWDALSEIERAALKGEIDMTRVFKPDANTYSDLMNDWGRWGEEVEVPFA